MLRLGDLRKVVEEGSPLRAKLLIQLAIVAIAKRLHLRFTADGFLEGLFRPSRRYQ